MTLLELRPGRVALDDLVDGLHDPPTVPARSSAPQPRRGHPLDDALLALPAEHYARMLAGLEASRAGKITCSFHRGDTTPSLQLYDDGSWYCFGCQRGGTIYDFAAALWAPAPSTASSSPCASASPKSLASLPAEARRAPPA